MLKKFLVLVISFSSYSLCFAADKAERSPAKTEKIGDKLYGTFGDQVLTFSRNCDLMGGKVKGDEDLQNHIATNNMKLVSVVATGTQYAGEALCYFYFAK